MKPQNTDKATARPWRISIKDHGEILDLSGNPINGIQRELIVKHANKHAALVAVAEAAEHVSLAVAEGCSSEAEYLIGLNSKLIDALASLTAVREGGAK